MPNVKIYIDEGLLRQAQTRVDALVLRLRDLLTSGLGVAVGACHIVILGVRSLAGQTPVNIELCLLQKPGRTKAMVEQVCNDMRILAAQMLEAPAAIRCTLAHPETYIVIRAG